MEYKIGIVVAEFNADITMVMLTIAKKHIEFLGGTVEIVTKVPGAFDMPLAIKKMLELEKIDGVVTLGAVVEGNTDHDSIVANNAARKIADLSVHFGKPVSLGISGPKMTRQDAIRKSERYAKDSVEAVFKLLENFKDIK